MPHSMETRKKISEATSKAMKKSGKILSLERRM